MKQSPQINIETIYEAVGYDGNSTLNWKEIHVTKYNRFGKIVYDFADLFHNMQLTETEYDEEGRHFKTTVRNLLLPDQEPIVIEGDIKQRDNKREEKQEDDSSYKLQVTKEKTEDGEELTVGTVYKYYISGVLESIRTTKYNSFGKEVYTLLKSFIYPEGAFSNLSENPQEKDTHTNEHIYGDFDQYGNWRSEKWVNTTIQEINGQEIHRETHTHHYRRAITYFDEE